MTLAITIFVLFACVAFVSPLHGLGFWLFLLITHGIFYQYMGQSAEHLPFFVGLSVTIAIVIKHHWKGINLGLIILVSTLLILMAIAGLFGINQSTSFVSILLFSRGFLLLILLASSLRSEDDVKVMTLYCLVGLLVGAAFAIFQKMTGTYAINTLNVHRAATLRGDPNDTAMLLVAGVPLCFYWLFAIKNKLVKFASAATLGALLTGIVLTSSRGGFVALLVVLLAIFLRRPSVRLFAVGTVIAVLMVALAPHSYWDRMKTIVTGKEQHLGHSLENRAQLQRVGMEIIYNNPLVGVGAGNFGQAYVNLVSSKKLSGSLQISMQQEETVSAAHNMYLEFFAENGMVGGFFFLMIMVFSMLNLVRYDHVVKVPANQIGLGYSLALALGGMLLAGLFLSQGKNSVLWFMLGIGFAMGAVRSEKLLSFNNPSQSFEEPVSSLSLAPPGL